MSTIDRCHKSGFLIALLHHPHDQSAQPSPGVRQRPVRRFDRRRLACLSFEGDEEQRNIGGVDPCQARRLPDGRRSKALQCLPRLVA